MIETVRVTADHIARGKRDDACACPIALAVKEQCGAEIVNVDMAAIAITRHGGDFEASLPLPASQFIGRFDLGLPVEPFKFTVTWQDWQAHL